MQNELGDLPWLLALASVIAVVWMARRCHRNWLSWTLGAGVSSLAASTIALGLMSAVFVPVSHEAVAAFRLKSAAAAVLAAAIPTALVMANLWFGRRKGPALGPDGGSNVARGSKAGPGSGPESKGA
jgi:hypothetical protein